MITFTEEQQAIANIGYTPGNAFAVHAYAGTGKTFILRHMAEQLGRSAPGVNILYLAFNKSVATEAQRLFPPFVRCSTVHALAMSRTGAGIRHKLKGNIRLGTLCDALEGVATIYRQTDEFCERGHYLQEIMMSTSTKWWFADLIKKTINKYQYSADPWPLDAHVPQEELLQKEELSFQPGMIPGIVHMIFKRMCDPQDAFPCLHDTYVKTYALSKPNLALEYHVVMLDEAQDANGVTMSIMNAAHQSMLVYVGDAHQQIYAWRGSLNIMDSIKSDYAYHITQSFRFGPGPAELSTSILRAWKNHQLPPVRGTGETQIVTVANLYSTIPPKCTYLARLNGTLLLLAIKLVKREIPFGFAGGTPESALQLIMDVCNKQLNNWKEIKSTFIKNFKSMEQLMIYAEYGEPELSMACRMISDSSAASVLRNIKDVIAAALDPLVHAPDILLSSCHKAKGMEWDTVVLDEDIARMFYHIDRQLMADAFSEKRYNEAQELERAIEKALPTENTLAQTEEANLLYVAITRAKNTLIIRGKLRAFIMNHTDLELPEMTRVTAKAADRLDLTLEQTP